MAFTIFDPTQTPYAQNNIIDNGGMEIWQRGVSFNNPVGLTADRWFISTSCTTYSVAQETGAGNFDSGLSSAKCTITTASGGVFRLGQSIENSAQYVGKPLSFSARVKSNVAGVKLFISYIGGQTASTVAHTGDNTWQTLTLTITPGTAGLSCGIGFDSVNTTVGTSVSPSNGIYYVDSVMMVVGSNPAPFVGLNLEVDLARCQRFYEIGVFADTKAIQRDNPGTPRNRTRALCKFSVQKQAAPTITTTINALVLCHLPTTGSTESSDTANWTASSAPNVGTNVITLTRNADQTTFPLLEINVSWTASADI